MNSRAPSPASDRLACLSPAERRLIEHLMRTGDIDKIAAYTLGISPRTLQTQKAIAFAKLEIKSLFELGVLACELGYYRTGRRSRASACETSESEGATS